jgi:molybdenum cofactor biosynthesis protein B
LQGIRVAILTASDTRKPNNDQSGNVIKALLERQGAEILAAEVVPDDIDAIRSLVRRWASPATVDAIVITGGTGIAPRDQTIEAIEPLLVRRLDGFGEAFRRLSFDAVGPHALLSRALAGVIDTCLVFALPGSPRAVELALERLIVPVLPHAHNLVCGQTGHHSEPVP